MIISTSPSDGITWSSSTAMPDWAASGLYQQPVTDRKTGAVLPYLASSRGSIVIRKVGKVLPFNCEQVFDLQRTLNVIPNTSLVRVSARIQKRESNRTTSNKSLDRASPPAVCLDRCATPSEAHRCHLDRRDVPALQSVLADRPRAPIRLLHRCNDGDRATFPPSSADRERTPPSRRRRHHRRLRSARSPHLSLGGRQARDVGRDVGSIVGT